MIGFTFGFGSILIVVVVLLIASSIRIFREYERGVVFMLGRFWKVKGPGLVLIIPVVQQVVRMDLRTVVFDVPRTRLRYSASAPRSCGMPGPAGYPNASFGALVSAARSARIHAARGKWATSARP